VTIQLDLYLVEITSVTEKLKLKFSLCKLPYIRYQLVGRTVQPRGRGSISCSVACFFLCPKTPRPVPGPTKSNIGRASGGSLSRYNVTGALG
jgi:hypothetical protein